MTFESLGASVIRNRIMPNSIREGGFNNAMAKEQVEKVRN